MGSIGKTYPACEYEVCKEKIREYATAVGETEPVYHDAEAARAAGFRDVVAPPMFAVVYSAGAMGPAILDPDLGNNRHGLYGMAQVARANAAAAGGDPRKLKRLSVQFRGMGFPEKEITVTGTVKEVRDGVAVIDTVAEQEGNEIIRNAEAEIEI